MAREKVELYKANQSAATMFDGENVFIHEGDLVRAGHPILKGREWLFEPAEDYVRFDVEQASAAPGEKRGRHADAKKNNDDEDDGA
jgi:hypothetical protein